MTQKYQVKVSMKQAAIVETGIVLKQGDFGMQIEIEVLDFDATGTTPQIVFRKAMGAVESTTITVSSNKYTYTFKGTELDTPGKVFCDLKLKNSTTQRISTASFMFKVVADTLDGLAEESSSYSDTIEQIVGGFDDEIDSFNKAFKNLIIDVPYFTTGTTWNVSWNSSTGDATVTLNVASDYISYLSSNGSNKSKLISEIPNTCSYASVNGRTLTFAIPNGYCIYWDSQNYVVKNCLIGNLPNPGDIDLLSVRYMQFVSGAWLEAIEQYDIKTLKTGQAEINNVKNAVSIQQGIPYFSAGTTFNVSIASGHTGMVFTANTPNGSIAFMTNNGSNKSKTLEQIAAACSYASVDGNTITFTIPNNYCIYWDYTDYLIKTAVIGAAPFNGIDLLCARYDQFVSGKWLETYMLNEIKTTKTRLTAAETAINDTIPKTKNVPYLTEGYKISVTQHGNGNVTLKLETTNGNINYLTKAGESKGEAVSSIPSDVSYASVSDNTITFVCPSNSALYYDVNTYKVKTCYPGNIPINGIDLFTVRYSHPVSGLWFEDYTYRTTRGNNNEVGWMQQRSQWSSYVGFSNENENGIDTFLSKMLDCSDNIYTALYFTDPHIWGTSKNQYSQTWMANMQRAFNISNPEDVVCGGDWLNAGATKAIAVYQITNTAAWMRYLFLNKFHFVLGNHDTNIYASGGVESETNRINYQQVARLCCHPYSDTPYYTYETQKAMIVVLNSGDKTNTETNELYNQFDWLYGKLINATKPVIIYVHAMVKDAGDVLYTASSDLMDFLAACNSKGSYTQFDATYDFSGATQKVKAIICGHTHNYSEREVNGIPIIVGDNVESGGYYYWIIADFTNDKIHVIDNINNVVNSYDMA